MSATTLLYPGDRTCRRRVTTLSTVSLEAELVSVTMTDLRSSMVSCNITVTSLASPRAPDVHDIAAHGKSGGFGSGECGLTGHPP